MKDGQVPTKPGTPAALQQPQKQICLLTGLKLTFRSKPKTFIKAVNALQGASTHKERARIMRSPEVRSGDLRGEILKLTKRFNAVLINGSTADDVHVRRCTKNCYHTIDNIFRVPTVIIRERNEFPAALKQADVSRL
jgi:hypothetical protein